MKNNLAALNNSLFEQMERINDDDLKGEELDLQLKKSKAIADIAQIVVNNSKQVLDSMKFMEKAGYGWMADQDSINLLVGGDSGKNYNEPNEADKKRMALNYYKEKK